MNPPLQGDETWKAAVDEIGDPLFIKVKSVDESDSILLAIGDGSSEAPITRHASETVEAEDAIIVSMKVDTWERLLNGSTDLMTSFMGRDIKAKASMFKLMKLTDPAEKLIQRMGAVQREVQ